MKMSNKNTITGKMMISLFVLIGLQINLLVAANPVENVFKPRYVKCETCNDDALVVILTPSVPAEATFSDEIQNADLTFAPEHLSPSVPREASFDDEPYPTVNFNIFVIAPITPAVDDFND